MTKPRFEYHEDTRRIHQRPTMTKNEDGSTSMSLGFPVCKVEEFITEPRGVLELMNKGNSHEALLEALGGLVENATYLTPVTEKENCRYCDEDMDHEGTFRDMHDTNCPIKAATTALSAARGTGV